MASGSGPSIDVRGRDPHTPSVSPIGDVAPATPDWIAPLAAAAVAALAFVVLVGWHFDVPMLRSGRTGQPAMPPLSAAALLLTAAALWLLDPRGAAPSRRGFGRVLAGLVCALGLATLLEYAFHVDLGFDLLLYPTQLLAHAEAPAGRPGVLTAGTLTLLGAALLLFGSGLRAIRIAQWLALAAGLTAAVPLLGHLYRIPALYAPAPSAPTALHTALGGLVLALGVLFSRRQVGPMATLTGRDAGGLTARRLLPLGLLLPVLLGALVAEVLRQAHLSPAPGLLLVAVVLGIVFATLVWRSARELRGIDRERRHTALALVQSEERFRSLAENAADAIITINARDAIVFANPAAERLFGYSAGELADMRFTELMPERHRHMHREGVHRYENTGRRRMAWSGIEFPGLHRDGREIPLEVTLGEYERDGRHYFTGIMRDITERRRAEAAQRLLLEAGAVLSASLDPGATLRGVTRLAVAEVADWCVVYRNRGDRLSAIELAARDLVREVRLRELERDHAPAGEHPAMDVVRTGQPRLFRELGEDDVAAIADDEEQLALLREVGYRSFLVVPLVARGRTIGALALGSGLGGARLDERDLATAQELAVRIAFAVDNARLYDAARAARSEAEERAGELERMTESRTRLVRGFSHDLKNPLSAADGHAQLLESLTLGRLSVKQRQSVGSIRRAIGNALELIEALVELARTEAGSVTLERQRTDPLLIAREIGLELRPQAEAKGLELEIEGGSGPAATADAARVRQILGNLVGNAIKYTDEGRVTVSVERVTNGPAGAGPWVRVDVEDTGPGIPPDQQARIFEEFTRLSGTVPGSGLGLAISRNLAEAMGGAITVRSEPGAGSRFTLWLPAHGSAKRSARAPADGGSSQEEFGEDGSERDGSERDASATL